MAYADYGYYLNVYFGSELSPKDALRYLTRASDWLDRLTRQRLKTAYPWFSPRVPKSSAAPPVRTRGRQAAAVTATPTRKLTDRIRPVESIAV